MKRWIVFMLTLAMTVSLTACGSEQSNHNSTLDAQKLTASQSSSSTILPQDTPNSESNGISSDKADDDSVQNNILIAYFTAAENSGVDAIASASYTLLGENAVGRVMALATMIQAETGGDLFSIQTSTVYPADGGELIDFAAEEQDQNVRPELVTHIENLEQYDTIFIGFPNWWYDMPMALYSFFDEYDFSGKTIIPFNVHNGSRFSSTIQTIQEMEPAAALIEDGFTVNERDVAKAAEDVAVWLDELGY